MITVRTDMRSGDGFLLVFSLTNSDSLLELHAIHEQIQRIKETARPPHEKAVSSRLTSRRFLARFADLTWPEVIARANRLGREQARLGFGTSSEQRSGSGGLSKLGRGESAITACLVLRHFPRI